MTPLFALQRALASALGRYQSDVLKEVLRALLAFIGWLVTLIGAPSLVLRTDEPNPSGNVFATWESLYAVLVTIKGFRIIAIDPTLNPIAQVPPSVTPYDLEGVVIQGLSSQIAPTLNIQNGATLQNVLTFRKLFVVGNRASNVAPPALTLIPTPSLGGGGPPLILFETAFLGTNTAFPPLVVDGGVTPFAVVELRGGGTLGDRSNPLPIWPVVRAQNGVQLQVVGFDQASVLDNFASGDPMSAVYCSYSDDCAIIPSAKPSGLPGPYFQQALNFQPLFVLYADDTFGNDEIGNGTVRRPFQTIARCLEYGRLNNAENLTIYLFPGVYAGASVLLTNTPLQRLTIEGQGNGVRGGAVTINGAPNGIEVVPTDQTEADQFVSLVLRNLLIQSPQVGILATDFTVNPTNFLNEGLVIDNCQIQGDFEAISLFKVGRVDAFDSLVGQATMDQCAGQRWCNVESAAQLTINTDRDNAMPFNSDVDMLFLGCRFFGIELTAQAHASFDKSCSCDQIGTASLAQSAGGFNPQVRFHGTTDSAQINTAATAGGAVEPPIYDLDDSTIVDLTIVDLASPTPPEVTARHATLAQGLGSISVSGNVNLNAKKADFPEASVAVAGGATVDSDTRSASSVTAVGAVAVAFPFPFPAGASYNVLAEGDAPVSVGITAKTGAGFDQTGSAPGVNLSLTAIRTP